MRAEKYNIHHFNSYKQTDMICILFVFFFINIYRFLPLAIFSFPSRTRISHAERTLGHGTEKRSITTGKEGGAEAIITFSDATHAFAQMRKEGEQEQSNFLKKGESRIDFSPLFSTHHLRNKTYFKLLAKSKISK